MPIHIHTGCSTPPPGPPPRATATAVHINRVSVLSGRVVSAYVKHRPEGSGPDDLSPDWRYERASVLPRSVVTAAREAAQRVGLDYAGVDVVEDRSCGRVYCLEANAAPGMSEDTVRSFYAHVQQALRGRAARAS